jgi:hypothetical protein
VAKIGILVTAGSNICHLLVVFNTTAEKYTKPEYRCYDQCKDCFGLDSQNKKRLSHILGKAF